MRVRGSIINGEARLIPEKPCFPTACLATKWEPQRGDGYGYRCTPRGLEDVELIARIQTGDERSIEVLLNRYRGFALSQTRIRYLNGADRDDVIQEAMIGLYKAVMDFDLNQDTPFSAFAQLCISRQVLTAVQNANRIKHQALNSSVSLDAPAFSEDEESVSIAERLMAAAGDDPAERVIAAEELEALTDLLRRNLTELENAVLRMYMDDRPYQQNGWRTRTTDGVAHRAS